MQFSQCAALLVLASSLAMAMPVPQAASPAVVFGRSEASSSIASQFVSVQKDASSAYKAESKDLKALDADTVTLEQVKPIIKRITATTKDLNAKISSLKEKAEKTKRQDLLAPAIFELINDLNTVLSDVRPLVAHLTRNLDLGTVQDLLNELTPALATLVAGVEALLASLAPGLSSLLDPVLHAVYGLTASLGLNLNLPAAK